MTTAAQHSVNQPTIAKTATLDITVLSGGPSREREVSLQSGQAVAEALTRLGHRVHLADISPDDLKALEHPADLVFVALHGTFGEDGQLQFILEQRGMTFVGSDAGSSALAMDKIATKQRFGACGIPTPEFAIVDAANSEQISAEWTVPAVAKAPAEGSSVDTVIARTQQTLAEAVSGIVQRHGKCLLERYISGPELTVGILGDVALPVCEIRTPRAFYDYAAKYLEDTTEYLFDVALPAELLETVQTLSLQAHQALGCREFSRVDWMIDRSSMRPFALEINTIPGFTNHSLLPKSAQRVDIDFDGLCQRLVDMAMRRSG